MAGERKGKTYEAIIKLVLEELFSEGVISNSIYWNKTPDEISIEPDFIIGPELNHPEIVFSVTHFTSPKESNRKAWRNIGEICEIKRVFKPRPKTISVVFDSLLKESMKAIQAIVFGRQLIVGDQPYGARLINWVERKMDELPSDQNEKYNQLRLLLESDKTFAGLVANLKQDLVGCIISEGSDLSQLWDIATENTDKIAPKAKDTYFRRGIAKRLLVGDQLTKEGEIHDENAAWLVDLGLVVKTLARSKTVYRVVDEQLKWFIDSQHNDSYKAISPLFATSGFYDQMEKVKSIARLLAYNDYIILHYSELITVAGMEDYLSSLFLDPRTGLSMPTDVPYPKNIWIYDYISALSKAAAGKSQAFGYSSFATHADAASVRVGSMNVGEWCSCFINQYFNRQSGFSLPKTVLHYIATVLSEELTKYSPERIKKLSDEIKEEYISKEYEATYLSHRGYEPLLSLLYFSGVATSPKQKKTIQTCFAEKIGLDKRSGTVTIVHINNTIILWKSSYDGHPADKQKEIAGLATGIRYTWDKTHGLFVERPNIQKMILLLDGNWKQHHLNFLLKSGWDEIYYPDELEQLKAAIV